VSPPPVPGEPAGPIRARQLLGAPKLWAGPVLIATVLIFLISLIYLGSIVNPTSHLHHLPVAVVDQDTGVAVNGTHQDLGREVASALEGSASMSRLLSLQPETLARAEAQMDIGHLYAAIVIPSNFSTSILAATKPAALIQQTTPPPSIHLLTNPRAGSVGVSLASAVIGSALPEISRQIAQKVLAARPAAPASTAASAAASAAAANPQLSAFITLLVMPHRPLPANAGLGLSAFYIALLSIMCGFLAATIVNSSVDSALGYGVSEIGPRWTQHRPVAITRMQTLLTKWLMAAALTPLLTGLLLVAGVAILRADAPHVVLLWLYTSFAAIVVALGTLFFFAALGMLGQVVALLVFIYLSLASSGGTIPLQAVPGFYRFVSNFEPLRQVLGGVRAILYFGAQGRAGLSHAWLMTGVGLVVWVVLGLAATFWYDRRGLYRLEPDLVADINQVIDDFRGRAPSVSAPPTVTDPSAGGDPGV
jgi:YhgE/Pip-like protein